MTMTPETTLTSAQFDTLLAIGAGQGPYCGMVPLAHLAVLLKADFIRAEGNGYSPTIAGMYRIVQDD
jgi:hypothetical protein